MAVYKKGIVYYEINDKNINDDNFLNFVKNLKTKINDKQFLHTHYFLIISVLTRQKK
jgi:hypothetical protein